MEEIIHEDVTHPSHDERSIQKWFRVDVLWEKIASLVVVDVYFNLSTGDLGDCRRMCLGPMRNKANVVWKWRHLLSTGRFLYQDLISLSLSLSLFLSLFLRLLPFSSFLLLSLALRHLLFFLSWHYLHPAPAFFEKCSSDMVMMMAPIRSVAYLDPIGPKSACPQVPKYLGRLMYIFNIFPIEWISSSSSNNSSQSIIS